MSEWLEDELYGRYEVELVVDVGSADQALEVAKALGEAARGLPVLGFELEVRSVVGKESKRRRVDGESVRWEQPR